MVANGAPQDIGGGEVRTLLAEPPHPADDPEPYSNRKGNGRRILIVGGFVNHRAGVRIPEAAPISLA